MNELYHFGIKGMRWGVRRTPEQLGHRKDKAEQRKADRQLKKDNKAFAKAFKKNWPKIAEKYEKEVNEKLIPALDKKYKVDKWFTNQSTEEMDRLIDTYNKEYSERCDEILKMSYESIIGKKPGN